MAKHKKNGEAHLAAHSERTITVQGLTVGVPAPFAEGHTLSQPEANALNQVLSENLRNNFASKVRKAKEAGGGTLSDENALKLIDEFNAYAASYSFASARQPRASVDPVTREAQKMAKAMIVEGARKNGVDPKTIKAERMEQYVAALLDKRPDIVAEAQARIDSAKARAADVMGFLQNLQGDPAA